MLEIARFYGIIIKMFFIYSEHNPPHIHAQYDGYVVSITIEDFRVLAGGIPPRAMKMVLEWLKIHKQELLEMWYSQSFHKVDALR